MKSGVSCLWARDAQTSGDDVTEQSKSGVFVDWYILESEDCRGWTDSSASASSDYRFVFESW